MSSPRAGGSNESSATRTLKLKEDPRIELLKAINPVINDAKMITKNVKERLRQNPDYYSPPGYVESVIEDLHEMTAQLVSLIGTYSEAEVTAMSMKGMELAETFKGTCGSANSVAATAGTAGHP